MKQILIGITGGIAAFKVPELIRELVKKGYIVKVIVTKAAKAFVTVTTLKAVSHDRVYETLFERSNTASIQHIELARWADIILIVPASAHIIAKLAHGFADDLLSTVCLAATGNIIVAPAMNQAMWLNPATQANVEILRQRNGVFLGPEQGEHVCGETGSGRLFKLDNILHYLESQTSSLLTDRNVLLTAGPTQEPLDPVRFIANYSSGKMAYALAHAAIHMGAHVTLISGPVALPPPPNCRFIAIKTAEDMLNAVRANIKGHDIFISAAAIADYQAHTVSPQKIKKDQCPSMTLQLKPTPDILSTVSNEKLCPVIVGFAAETENSIDNARRKLNQKKVDMMIVNNVADKTIGFGSDYNEVAVLFGQETKVFKRTAKVKLAIQLLELMAEQFFS